LLLPDDLTLATVLKGPLFGIDEETLFDLAYDRGSETGPIARPSRQISASAGS
jgi:ATP-dependent helicase/nuclease subunit A